MIKVFTVSYDAQSPARQAELLECLRRNLPNPHLGQIFVWKYSGETPAITHPKLILRHENRPPTYDDFFTWANDVCEPGDVAVIANSDVWFDETAKEINQIQTNQFFAMLRWEADGRIFSSPDAGPRWDSQDAWIFRPPIPLTGVNYGLGMPRNDNAFAYEIWRRGFDLRNPAQTIRIHHLHASAVRPYASTKFRILPPWLHIEPTAIGEAGRVHILRKTFHPKWQFLKLRAWLKKICGQPA